MIVLGGVLAAAAGWAVAPLLDMTVRGTTDQRTLACWRTEGVTPAASPVVALPAQRTGSESLGRVPA